MSNSLDSRACGRISIRKPIQVVTRGKAVSYALAINIGLGGLLLSAAPSLPVGSSCKLAIPPAGDLLGANILLEGTVIRSDSNGLAVRFATLLEGSTLEAIANQPALSLGNTLVNTYLNYFKVSQNEGFEGAMQLLGISPVVFRRVFLATFSCCIPLATLPVWMIKDSIFLLPVWMKVLMSFAYATIWFGVIQPISDLLVFKFIREKHPVTRG
jgi:hypothetical protein